jgi:hypothetical protein
MPFLRVLLLFPLLILIGCVGVPKQELVSYRDAYSEARKAGDLLYDEISSIISARNGETGAGCSSSGASFPKCFDPNEVSPDGRKNEDPAIRARRLSLALLEEYNVLLIDLAEGKSQAELKQNITDMAGLANDLIGLAGISSGGLSDLFQAPVVNAFADFAVRLEGMRANAVVRQAIINDRGTISELFDALIADTPKMYEIYKKHQIGVWNASTEVHGFGSAEAKRELDRIAAFHTALSAYVNMLEATRKSHALLAESASAQVNSVNDIRNFVTGAIEIRQSATEFWNKIRDVRD